MKAALAALALTTLAVATPATAQASGGVTIRVDTPEFGIRIGTPVRFHAPLPVYAPPVFIPAPVYAPPVPVAYVPPRVVVRPPVVYHVIEPYPYRPIHKHWKNKHRHRHYDGFRGYHYERD